MLPHANGLLVDLGGVVCDEEDQSGDDENVDGKGYKGEQLDGGLNIVERDGEYGIEGALDDHQGKGGAAQASRHEFSPHSDLSVSKAGGWTVCCPRRFVTAVGPGRGKSQC